MHGLSKGKTKLGAPQLVITALAIIAIFFVFHTDRSSAQVSIGELQAIILELQAKAASLQSQLLAITGGPSTAAFERNLSIGDSGLDVKALQQRLNEDPLTKVAETGVGSSGNETAYFGTLTRSAVIRYQELYRDEILTPVGLVNGSGYVGESTRTHLISSSAISTDTPAPELLPESTPEPSPFAPEVNNVYSTLAGEFQESDELTLAFPSRYDGSRGTALTLSGFGFEKENNTVHLGDTAISGIPSQTGTSITLTIPADAPFGKHVVYVTNAKGRSDGETFFVVLDPSMPRPKIISSSPTEGLYGEEVTITGSGFTPTGNDIYTSYDVITDVTSPDGTTLSFRVLPFPEVPFLEVGKDLGQGTTWSIWFYVVNDNGVGSNFGNFQLTI